jgi:hypothetical protein
MSVADHQLVGIRPAAAEVAVGLHSSMRLVVVLVVVDGSVLVFLDAVVEGLALAGEGY